VANIRNNPLMLDLFSRLGMLARLQSKLNTLSRKKGRIIPAKKTIACALRACEETDNQDIVFAGVEFLGHYHTEEETVAGVLAHEWGHLLSELDRRSGSRPDELGADPRTAQGRGGRRRRLRREDALPDGLLAGRSWSSF
jgi:hypothetical protein